MRFESRRITRSATPVGRGIVAVTAVVCLAAGCTSGPEDRGAAQESRSPGTTATATDKPRREADAAPRTRAAEPESPLPTRPARDPAALADELDDAVRTLRDQDAPAAEVRRAGELYQLAVRRLADRGARYRRLVAGRLEPEAGRVVRADVRAARALGAMTTPQRRLPHWRIVSPSPPAELLGHYRRAQRRTGVPWTYLAAINLVESRMGRIRGTSTAGARGPMQFLPATWRLYGAGGDINDPRDAILGAARLLRANGAPRHMREALRHYNNSSLYVQAVHEHAQALRRSPWLYRGYWQWRVLYRHQRGTYVLPVGYPDKPPELLPQG